MRHDKSYLGWAPFNISCRVIGALLVWSLCIGEASRLSDFQAGHASPRTTADTPPIDCYRSDTNNNNNSNNNEGARRRCRVE